MKLKKQKRRGPLSIVQADDPETRKKLFRGKVINWLKTSNFPPEEVLDVLASLVGTLAAGLDVGKRKTGKLVKKAYVSEKKRQLASKLEQAGA